MKKKNAKANLQKKLFKLLIRRVDLHGELASVNEEIEYLLDYLEDDDIRELFASVDAYLTPHN